jgi:hypothetical protein
MPLDNQKGQPVGQREAGDFLLEILEALGGHKAGEQKQ